MSVNGRAEYATRMRTSASSGVINPSINVMSGAREASLTDSNWCTGHPFWYFARNVSCDDLLTIEEKRPARDFWMTGLTYTPATITLTMTPSKPKGLNCLAGLRSFSVMIGNESHIWRRVTLFVPVLLRKLMFLIGWANGNYHNSLLSI